MILSTRLLFVSVYCLSAQALFEDTITFQGSIYNYSFTLHLHHLVHMNINYQTSSEAEMVSMLLATGRTFVKYDLSLLSAISQPSTTTKTGPTAWLATTSTS